jgi:rRNA maturation RNase YbeY
MTLPKLQVNLKNYQRKWPIDRNRVLTYVRKVWKAISVNRTGAQTSPTEVTVVFVNDATIRDYNKRYRGKDYATDVLSFPVNELHDGSHYLGDILISMQRTAAQAIQKKHTLQRELKILLLHGILHLLGYDHETDQGQMDRLERRLRKIVL